MLSSYGHYFPPPSSPYAPKAASPYAHKAASPYAHKAASPYTPKAAGLPHKTSDLHAENDKLRLRIQALNTTCDHRHHNIDVLERERSALKTKNDILREAVATVKEANRDSHEREKVLVLQVEDAEREIERLREEIQKLKEVRHGNRNYGAPPKHVHFGERTYWR
ncbi:MAG: hypothetical protein LQ349_004473 [Xanthoria aureola]|nr:MAG: hypothetical protein LQ349_004473 [Xanthoria aureola]